MPNPSCASQLDVVSVFHRKDLTGEVKRVADKSGGDPRRYYSPATPEVRISLSSDISDFSLAAAAAWFFFAWQAFVVAIGTVAERSRLRITSPPVIMPSGGGVTTTTTRARKRERHTRRLQGLLKKRCK